MSISAVSELPGLIVKQGREGDRQKREMEGK
jgi:hypothetical protein